MRPCWRGPEVLIFSVPIDSLRCSMTFLYSSCLSILISVQVTGLAWQRGVVKGMHRRIEPIKGIISQDRSSGQIRGVRLGEPFEKHAWSRCEHQAWGGAQRRPLVAQMALAVLSAWAWPAPLATAEDLAAASQPPVPKHLAFAAASAAASHQVPEHDAFASA